MAMGRPTDYIPVYAEQAYRLTLLGLTDAELASYFECAPSTLHKWKLEHPEFSESIKAGKAQADANVTQSLYEKATGWTDCEGKKIPPDSTAMIFWLKNRQRKYWRDKWPDEEEKKTAFDPDTLMRLLANAQQQVAEMKAKIEALEASKQDGI